MISGIIGVFLRELYVFKNRFFKVVLSSSVSPLLFLLVFGFGVGKSSFVGDTSYINFLIPGLITMSSMNQAYGISTEINISRFYFKVFDEYLLAPIPKWQIIAGEMLYGILKGLIPAFIVLFYAFVLGINIDMNIHFVSILLLHLMIFSLLGFIAALVVKNHADQFAINTFIITPMIFLSGTFYPIDKLPGLVKFLAYFFPLTYTNRLIRNSLLYSQTEFSIIVLLLFFTFVLFLLACYIVYNLEAN